MVTIVQAFLVLVTVLFANPFGAQTAAPAPTTVLHQADAAWSDEVDWAHARLEGLGLAPVDVPIHVWADAEAPACAGNAGLFTATAGQRRIDICMPLLDSDLGTEIRRKVLLHELGHAWVHQHVSLDQRTEFMEARGAESWNGSGVSHHARGTEYAANAIMWVALGSSDVPAGATTGYEILTGRHGG